MINVTRTSDWCQIHCHQAYVLAHPDYNRVLFYHHSLVECHWWSDHETPCNFSYTKSHDATAFFTGGLSPRQLLQQHLSNLTKPNDLDTKPRRLPLQKQTMLSSSRWPDLLACLLRSRSHGYHTTELAPWEFGRAICGAVRGECRWQGTTSTAAKPQGDAFPG